MQQLYQKTPGGTWYGRYYTLDGQRQQVCLRTKDRKAAAQRLRELERQPAAKADRTENSPSLLKVLDEFLRHVKQRRSHGTYTMYDQKGRHLLRVFGPDRTIGSLTRDDVKAYVAQREVEGAHGGTVYKEVVALRQCLKYALNEKLYHQDPRAIFPEVRNQYEPRTRYLTEAQADDLLGQLQPHRAWWVLVAVYTGMRRSELERLRVEDIDLEGKWIRVPGTKTKKAKRVIPLPTALAKALPKFAPKQGPVVQPWSWVGKGLADACKRAGVPRVSPNDLRRTFGSWLKQAGEDSLVVARLLGHSSTAMVERVYGHLGDANYRAAMKKLPAGIAGIRSVSKPGRSKRQNGRMGLAQESKNPSQGTSERGLRVSPVGVEPTTRGLRVRVSPELTWLNRSITPRTKKPGIK